MAEQDAAALVRVGFLAVGPDRIKDGFGDVQFAHDDGLSLTKKAESSELVARS
jgi:hypothetical protein